ncbi:MAG: Fur family transcriptional regulator [Alphaproteobacteria bacterium]|nr:Fur family transcriptional regulator [Alphaproteobacteria bacterium]
MSGATTGLTRNQSLVLGALRDASGPLSAYAILDCLRKEGLRAPPQVYRALDQLIEHGLVHRLESMNAFVPCHHDHDAECGGPAEPCGHEKAGAVVFAICRRCDKVLELTDPELSEHLAAIASAKGFAPDKATIELQGACAACAEPQPEDGAPRA